MKTDTPFYNFFHFLLDLSPAERWAFFLAENLGITLCVLVFGRLLQKQFSKSHVPYSYSARERIICLITNILNTVVTYAGFWLWQTGHIAIGMQFSLWAVSDFIILFLAMDFLMYVFHFIIHRTFLYRAMHQLHHQSVDPKPIDLFVLHPVETISFGALWLILLMLYAFNVYAILAYLAVNVVFGLIGHLGLEPLPEKLRIGTPLKFLGTSTFHHNHHQDVSHNFGFYTTLWDRMFGTYR
jgi:sterol desaturase/sphingolipid hydroxylase (fatty acid hydroxylase superfamily)